MLKFRRQRKEKKRSLRMAKEDGMIHASTAVPLIQGVVRVPDLPDEDALTNMIRQIIREEASAQNGGNGESESQNPSAPASDVSDVTFRTVPQKDVRFEHVVRSKFNGAIDNDTLVKIVGSILKMRDYTSSNTLLATSLCCDEVARQLEEDFGTLYGRNFALGGLAGFPFAGTTGFGAMSHHIPDGGHCLVVYGPHVGITRSGRVGKVERDGIECPDTCCGSAVAASNYVKDITEGRAKISADLRDFTDFQQGAVQQLTLPHSRRLQIAKDRMAELPHALFESQDHLMSRIAESGASGTRNGLIMLGGIQINTGPATPDYFHPLRFVQMNKEGKIVEDLLPQLQQCIKVEHDESGELEDFGLPIDSSTLSCYSCNDEDEAPVRKADPCGVHCNDDDDEEDGPIMELKSKSRTTGVSKGMLRGLRRHVSYADLNYRRSTSEGSSMKKSTSNPMLVIDEEVSSGSQTMRRVSSNPSLGGMVSMTGFSKLSA